MKAIVSKDWSNAKVVHGKNNTTCDKCKQTFKIHMNIEELGEVAHYGEVTRRYMKCPHCGEEYSMGFLNAEVDELVASNVQLLKILTKQSTQQIKRNKAKGEKLMRRIETAWRKQQNVDN